MIGLGAEKRIEEDRRNLSDEVVLADTACGLIGLAHDNVTQPDIMELV